VIYGACSYGFSARLGECGGLLYYCLKDYPNLEKRSIMTDCDKSTHPIFNGGAHFDKQIFFIFRDGWIEYRDAFYLILYYVIMLCNWLKMSEYEAYWITNFPLINGWASTV